MHQNIVSIPYALYKYIACDDTFVLMHINTLKKTCSGNEPLMLEKHEHDNNTLWIERGGG